MLYHIQRIIELLINYLIEQEAEKLPHIEDDMNKNVD